MAAVETALWPKPEPCYRFRGFELKPTERQLLRNGMPTGLGGRAFDVLTHLIRCAGRVVWKDELLEAVWQRRVVEENNLQKQISTLRKMIGRHAIAAVSGCGYQFVAPLLPTAESMELPHREPAAPEVLHKYI
jgi:DNA-binding winged helix-turn-helix (wHTH) protein